MRSYSWQGRAGGYDCPHGNGWVGQTPDEHDHRGQAAPRPTGRDAWPENDDSGRMPRLGAPDLGVRATTVTSHPIDIPTAPWLIQPPIKTFVPTVVLFASNLSVAPVSRIAISQTAIGKVTPAESAESACERSSTDMPSAERRSLTR